MTKNTVQTRLARKLIILQSTISSKFWRVKYHDLNNLINAQKSQTSYVITGNHDNKGDGGFVINAIRKVKKTHAKRGLFCVVKKKIETRFLTGSVVRKSKSTIGISRKKGCLTQNVMHKINKGVLDEGAGLMFMQASTQQGPLRKVCTGPIRVAEKTGLPLLPIGIYPRYRTYFIKAWLKGGIHITFGKPTYIKKCTAKTYEKRKQYYREQTNKMWEEVQRLVEISKRHYEKRKHT